MVADLRQHDCTAALTWCEEHRSRLKKGKNKLEFRLRMQVSILLLVPPALLYSIPHWQQVFPQEFVELVRQGKMMQAIKYARGYLAPWASVYLQELQV